MAELQIVEEMLNGFNGFNGFHTTDGNNQYPDLNLNARDENLQDMNGPVTVSELRDDISEFVRIINKVNSKMSRFHDDWVKKNSLIPHFEVEINDLKNDLQQKNEELENANLTILHLTESNQTLTIEKEMDKALLLQYEGDVSKAFQLAESYKNDLEAKSKLAEMYLEEDRKNKSYMNGLNAKVQELLKETTTKLFNVFGGSSGLLESQNELNDDTTPKMSFHLESAAVLAESPPPPSPTQDENVSMFQSLEESSTILRENCLENDKGELSNENSDDVFEIVKRLEKFPTTNSSSVTQESLKRMGSHDESISKVQNKRFRANEQSFEDTNSENHNMGLDNDEEKITLNEIEESSAANTSEQEVLEEDSETKKTSYAKCDAVRCSVRLERISRRIKSTTQPSISPHSEDSAQKSARKKIKSRRRVTSRDGAA